jgi:DNA-binding YbaB/EbfC family protein
MAKGMGNMMKQAQKLQSKIFKLQEELAERTVETTVGGGMVKAVANGKQELLSIKIDPEVVDPNDVQMLEDLIVAAINDVLKKAQEMVSEEMTKLTGGFKIPGIT